LDKQACICLLVFFWDLLHAPKDAVYLNALAYNHVYFTCGAHSSRCDLASGSNVWL